MVLCLLLLLLVVVMMMVVTVYCLRLIVDVAGVGEASVLCI